ncbi:MAG TPA: methylmalonyl Co-A mutase-associated GTPase MeaB [Gemmatimonadales bacterium]|nr:methylmalonyl Co-A mutase-associated GTPase MeaB [Gemmatimonadales bacterium]
MLADRVLADLLAGRTAAVARAISVVENGQPGFEALLAGVHPHLGRARRIGLTGPPGAGKSTLAERLVAAYRARDLSVAVVAVDPTSPFTGGALLGDRIRMEAVALDAGVFIRSMASRGSLGGLATTTREVCDLLDAAGFARIVVETVGVGQAELDVALMADTTALVLVPESGDGIQTLKSGIMEAADLFVVNKADRPGAEKLGHEIEVMLGIRSGGRRVRPATAWTPPVLLTNAARGDGVDPLVDALDRHHGWLVQSGELERRRRDRLLVRTREVVERAARRWLWSETTAERLVGERLGEIAEGRLSPYEVAAEIIEGLRQGERV